MTEPDADKPIRLSGHARGYLDRRGFTEAEVERTIRTNPWLPARHDRLEATMDFAYDDEWNGIRYAAKQVRAVFVSEPEEIVVITVYTYFF